MSARFQYQQWAEPVFSGETITPDKWLGFQPVAVAKKAGLTAAILAGAFFFTNFNEPVNAQGLGDTPVYPDKIYRQTFPAYEQQSLAFVAPEPNNYGYSCTVYPDKVDRKQFHASQQQSIIDCRLPEVQTADRWIGHWPDRIDRPKIHPSAIPYYFWYAYTYVLIYPEAQSKNDAIQAKSMRDSIRAKDDT